MAVFDDIERNELGPRPYARNPTSFPQRHRLAREFKQFEVAVLERRVRLLSDTHAGQGVRFFAPGVASDDVEKLAGKDCYGSREGDVHRVEVVGVISQ